MPVALAVASLVALITGLLGDDGFDVVSWVGLALPLIAIARALWIARTLKNPHNRW
ncbi:MAG: hypothetical protein PGN16_06415 [Sphingomonas phyllosphaerae]|uniref:hypothetical protein n=1 Tax=Sphingomonas phyllosphaerae TaxID=257003 RepID=UPI002FFB34DE